MGGEVIIGGCSLYLGDCLEIMASLTDKLDAVVCDPPYHLTSIVKRFGKPGAAAAQEGTDGRFARASRGFMGKEWDGGDIAFRPETWRMCWELLKPGAHLIAFSGTRTYHRMACAIEDAGFEIRDQLAWCYGSGFPKSHDVEKKLGAEWKGWGTALKPAWEPIVLARKPLSEGTVAANVAEHGTGGINVDGCRVETTDKLGGGAENLKPRSHTEGWDRPWMHDDTATTAHSARVKKNVQKSQALGRWPANIIHDGSDEVMTAFPDDIDSGSAARFFYSAKADADDRFGSKHPTVKPVDLMAWLIRLVTPRGGLVMDPFAGSGTTGVAALREGCRAILIERDKEYFEDIIIRLRHTQGEGAHSGSLKTRNKAPREALPLFQV